MAELNEKTYEGIKGWLILPLLGLLIAPFRIALLMYRDFWPLFSEGYWSVLTTPGSEEYHPLLAPLLVFEVGGNLLIIVLDLVALWFFFKKSHLAPKIIIAFLIIDVLFVGGDFSLSHVIPGLAPKSDPESARELARAIVGVVIWIPYFLVSKRVKSTFVR